MRGVAVVLLLAMLAVPCAAVDGSAGFEPEAWLQGVEGLYQALRTLREAEPPALVVYFYTDWCGYCRQFEKELLGSPQVKDYFSSLLAVRINPENGAEARRIADYYGVRGYPAFFVHDTRSKILTRVERMLMEDGRPRLKTPTEFIATVRDAAGR